MPSKTLTLPLHVEARKPRRDGTQRVLFVVRRNRPDGWPKQIPLPLTGPRTGKLDADEIARIVADVEGTAENNFQDGLLARLEAARAGPAPPARGAVPDLVARWRRSAWWLEDLKPRTRNFYEKNLRHIEIWSASKGHPHFRTLTAKAIFAYLKRWDRKPAMQAGMKRTISALASFAFLEGDITAHPLGVPARLRKAKDIEGREVAPWDRETVTIYGQAAIFAGWPDGAIMLWLMWETSADESDVVTWRKDKHFRDTAVPAIVFARGKTGAKGVIPISHALAAAIRANGQIYLVTDPNGAPFKADDVQDDNRRGRLFMAVRDIAIRAGAPKRLKDHLRHSAATHAVECGATTEATRSLTLHRTGKMLQSVYMLMTEKQAAAVQRARGIIT